MVTIALREAFSPESSIWSSNFSSCSRKARRECSRSPLTFSPSCASSNSVSRSERAEQMRASCSICSSNRFRCCMIFWLFSGFDQKSGACVCSSSLFSCWRRAGASKIAPHSFSLLAERSVLSFQFLERHPFQSSRLRAAGASFAAEKVRDFLAGVLGVVNGDFGGLFRPPSRVFAGLLGQAVRKVEGLHSPIGGLDRDGFGRAVDVLAGSFDHVQTVAAGAVELLAGLFGAADGVMYHHLVAGLERVEGAGAAFTDRAGAMNGRFGGDMKDILGPIRGPDRDGFRGAIDGMHGPGHGVGFFGRPQGNGQQAEQTNQFHKALRVFRC